MPNILTISSPDEPALVHYRGLVDPQRQARELRGELSHFIAEGQWVVEKLIDSSLELHSLLMTPERAELMAPILARVHAPVFVAPVSVIQEIAGFEFHRGVLACGVRPAANDCWERVRRARVILALEQVSNPDNVGGLLRSLAGLAGASGALLLGPGCSDPLYRKCIRVSMGHVFGLPWAMVDDLHASVRSLQDSGAAVLATTPEPGAEDLRRLGPLPDRVVVLLGAEGPGLTPNIMQTACRKVRIPMCPGVDSLNVGVAGAIVLDRVIERLGGEPIPISGV